MYLHAVGRPNHVFGRPVHVWDMQTMYLDGTSDVQTMHFGVFACVGAWRARPGVALPGFEEDGRGGPWLANSLGALETAVRQRLDAALTGSRSYFGALVPCKK